jgi:short-subunit dehydrogenase
MQKILIIGATSGIGRELARQYAAAGHLVGATGRRQDMLYSLQLEYPNNVFTQCYDTIGGDAMSHLGALEQKLGGMDLLIYNAGWGDLKEKLDWEVDKATVDVNVNGF